jgi:hypothetical protein
MDRRGRGRPRHNVGRTSSSVRSPEAAWKSAKLQGRAGTPAPQCGTGVLVRQIAESGLEIGQTPAAGGDARALRSILLRIGVGSNAPASRLRHPDSVRIRSSETARNTRGFPRSESGLKQPWICQKRQNLAYQASGLAPIDNAMIKTERQFSLETRLELA